MKIKSIILIGAYLYYTPLQLLAQSKELPTAEIFANMFSSIKNVKTLRANMTSTERIIDHVTQSHYTIKLNVSPYKTYSKDIDKGAEVLYLEGKNDNEAIVNPNGFPYVNVHLDPLNKLMRKAQHQTIGRAGFNYISDVFHHFIIKYPDAYSHYVKRDADTIWDGSSCYKMEINFSEYTNTNYTIKEKGETVSKLAAEYYLSDYQILTLNNISWYDTELKVGQQILLPNAYAKTTILFVRKDNFLPVVARTYDDKGFFEEYKYSGIQINSTIPDVEFTEKYPGYHF